MLLLHGKILTLTTRRKYDIISHSKHGRRRREKRLRFNLPPTCIRIFDNEITIMCSRYRPNRRFQHSCINDTHKLQPSLAATHTQRAHDKILSKLSRVFITIRRNSYTHFSRNGDRPLYKPVSNLPVAGYATADVTLNIIFLFVSRKRHVIAFSYFLRGSRSTEFSFRTQMGSSQRYNKSAYIYIQFIPNMKRTLHRIPPRRLL